MKFVQLNNSLKEGLQSFYLIEGDDAYFRDCAVSAIRRACLITQPMLNDSSFEGETLHGDALSSFVGTLYTMPMFDDRRLVRVNGFYPSEKEWENSLKPYAEKPCPSTVLVVVNTGKKAGACDLKRKGAVTFVDCSRESEETLTKWLFTLMRRSQLDPDQDAVSTMVRYCACDCARMKSEVEKFAILLGENGRVTRDYIEENVAKDVDYKIYELTQAASRKNFSVFSSIMSDLLQRGFDEIAVLSSLTSHYKTLSEIGSLSGSDREVADILGMKPYAVTKNREMIARLKKPAVDRIYLGLYELSSGAKSGLYQKSGALTAAIAKIFFG